MGFGQNITTLNFEFTPREKYQEIYSSQVNTRFIPEVRLNAEGKIFNSRGRSGSFRDHPLSGSFSFAGLPIAKLNTIQIIVSDNFALVDWKVPIDVQEKIAEAKDLSETIFLPEGKLNLTGISQGTKSTSINISFEPAVGFEGINSINLDAFLRSDDKYYNKYSFHNQNSVLGLTGTIKFDPVRYDNLKELEFILGSIQYTYKTNSSVNISPETIPQTINVLGNDFIIDKMEYKSGETLLHIDYGSENRKFYNADLRIDAKKSTSFSYRSETKQGYIEYRDKDQLIQSLEKLKSNLGDYDLDLLNEIDLNKGYIGSSIVIKGEHEEVEIHIEGLKTMNYSGEMVKIKLD